MDNRFFSLIIVPDSSNDLKIGSFNFKFVLYLLGFLIATFILCLFFVIGYHIKLSQEKEYKSAVSKMYRLLNDVDNSKKQLNTFYDKLLKIRDNDVAFRQFANMNILDKNMYNAGMGGHTIIDDSVFDGLNGNYKDELKKIAINTMLLDSRVNIQNISLNEIYVKIRQNQKEINSTPSMLPTDSFRITSDYRWRIHPVKGVREFHDGVDLAGKLGDSIYATADGTVILIKRTGALGRCIRIAHGYGFETLYGHLSKINVEIGQKVKKNDVIGTMGNSGRSTGVHVHYAVSLNAKKVNPKQYF